MSRNSASKQSFKAKDYVYRVQFSPKDSEFVASCLEFPALSAHSDSPSDAIESLMTLVASLLKKMARKKEAIPTPLNSVEYSGKITLRLSPEAHKQLAFNAKESGVSINRYAADKIAGQ